MRALFACAFVVVIAAPSSAEPIRAAQITVVDGDTIDAHQHRWRLVGFDTPEVTNTPRRRVGPHERAAGRRASARLSEILASGHIDLTEVKCACDPKAAQCNYGRKCGVLKVNGHNVGETLIREGLARPYTCSLITYRCRGPKPWWR